MLNLKIKRADKNAANLYHMQMASLQVEIELGLLSDSERARRDWFPEWFSYSMTETEQRLWKEYMSRNPLKWTEENNFGEEKDHAPQDVLKDPKPVGQPTAPQSSGASSGQPQDPSTENTSQSRASKQSSEDARNTQHNPISTVVEPQRHTGSSTVAESDRYDCDDDTDIDITADQPTQPPSVTGDSTASLPPSDGRPHCVLCGQPGSMCKGCHTLAYCSKEHQKADWKTHKTECKKLGKAKAHDQQDGIELQSLNPT